MHRLLSLSNPVVLAVSGLLASLALSVCAHLAHVRHLSADGHVCMCICACICVCVCVCVCVWMCVCMCVKVESQSDQGDSLRTKWQSVLQENRSTISRAEQAERYDVITCILERCDVIILFLYLGMSLARVPHTSRVEGQLHSVYILFTFCLHSVYTDSRYWYFLFCKIIEYFFASVTPWKTLKTPTAESFGIFTQDSFPKKAVHEVSEQQNLRMLEPLAKFTKVDKV